MNSSFNISTWEQPLYELYQKSINHFWKPPESDKFKDDIEQWENGILYDGVKSRLKSILVVFTLIEQEIIENIEGLNTLLERVMPETSYILKMLLNFQETMEGIHLLSYVKIDQNLPLDSKLKDIYNLFIKAKVDALRKCRNKTGNDKRDLARALICFCANEGIILNTLFVFPMFLRKKALLPETTFVNKEVLIDENLHTEIYYTLYNILCKLNVIDRLPESEVYEIIDTFVKVDDISANILLGDMDKKEEEFFLIMNVENSKKYTRCIANDIISKLGYKPFYISDNPYPFMDKPAVKTLASYFTSNISEYGIDDDTPYNEESDPEDN